MKSRTSSRTSDKLRRTVAARLRKLGVDSGLNQSEIAKRCGVTRAQVCNIENGVGLPSLTSLVALAKLHGVTTDYLLGVGP
jgi:transcriptional regulator with XRE-family HTH domain